MPFHIAENFRLFDDQHFSYFLDIERHSSFSHSHGLIMDDGTYRVTLNGNKHLVASPPLRNFKFAMDFNLKLAAETRFGYGFQLFFRYNRSQETGQCLAFHWDQNNLFELQLNEKVVFSRPCDAVPDFLDEKLIFEVRDERARVVFKGEEMTFDCPDESGLPKKGAVGFDMIFAPGCTMSIRQFSLDSEDELPLQPTGRPLHFNLRGVHGCTEHLKYDLSIADYGDSVVMLDCTLSGGIQDRGERMPGGRGWCYEIDRITKPYLRIETTDGEYRNIYFDQGCVVLFDKEDERYYVKILRKAEWPMHIQLVCTDFPKNATIAAGYEYCRHAPWRFVSGGPYEQIQDLQGNIIYEGDSLRNDNVAVRVKSPEDKMLVARIPKKIVWYDKALRHAKEQHYFYDDEAVTFELLASSRTGCYEPHELQFGCTIQDPYGDDVPGVTCSVTDLPPQTCSFITAVRKKLLLNKCLPNGIYHLKLTVKAGFKTVYDDNVIFEILPEDPDALPPPLASGLPIMLSMNNEIANLMTDAFDPYEDWGGMGHYYTMVMRYPAVGKMLRVWEILKIYHRKWFLMLSTRNTKDVSYSDSNMDLIRHADYVDFNSPDRLYSQSGPQFLFRKQYYCEYTLKYLAGFIRERNPPLKILTAEACDEIYAKDPTHTGYITSEQLEDLVNTCWDEWLDYYTEVVHRENQEHVDRMLAVNPKVARGGYGPFPLYVSNYKSAYSVRLGRNGQRVDQTTNDNGSFFFMEDYHLSCDYPLSAPQFFTTSYRLLYPDGRKLYPEIYYGGGFGCNDGAVYMAHPPFGRYDVITTHQKRIVYEFAFATPFFKDGSYDYWRDYGFHCPTPDPESFKMFIHAWGKLIKNSPARQLPAPFIILEPKLLRLHGDYFEEETNYAIPTMDAWTDTANTAEEAMAFSFYNLVHDGYNTPVLTIASQIDALTPDKTPYIVLPAIEAGAPQEILDSIRAAHQRGIGLLAYEAAAGLEDLFGIRPLDEPLPLRIISGETFKHKKAVARYAAEKADVIMKGAAATGGQESIPVVMTNTTPYGRTAFFNVPPTVVKREDFRQKLGFGQKSISKAMPEALARVSAFLDPAPAVRAERGGINACLSVNGDVIVTLSEDSRFYGDSTRYPVTFRFRITHPGIGKAVIETEEPYSVVEKTADSITLRTQTMKDNGLFFKFQRPGS